MKTLHMTMLYALFLWVLAPAGISDLGSIYPTLNSMNALNHTKDTIDQLQQPRLQEKDNTPAVAGDQHHLINEKYQILTYVSLGLLFISLLAGFLYFRKLIKESKKLKKENQLLAQEKEQFIAEQIKQYDRRILQMLIVKAEYEDMKKKLKKEFGLGDDDFSIDSPGEG